jgi:predicted amidophosphoribosyltransferase
VLFIVLVPAHFNRLCDIQFHARLKQLDLRDLEQIEHWHQRRRKEGREQLALLSLERPKNIAAEVRFGVGVHHDDAEADRKRYDTGVSQRDVVLSAALPIRTIFAQGL